MLKFLRGTCRMVLTGASPEACLNRWAAADLPFWDLEQPDPLQFRCTIYRGHRQRAARLAQRAQCRLELLEERGLPRIVLRLARRPALVLGMILALALGAFAQNFIWFFTLEGNDDLPADRILHAMEEEGLSFGAWGPAIDTEVYKNLLLNRLPELRWIAVNRDGCLVRVLAARRDLEASGRSAGGPANLVAALDGVVTELRVLNGFAQVATGDPVRAGQILVSGSAEWTTHTQITRAEGEVYGQTLRQMDLIVPGETLKKAYTGREAVVRTLIFQRKRRKISGNSGIFGTTCDKMVEIKRWTLPGGYVMPLSVETLTLREYALIPGALSGQRAADLLNQEALALTQAAMTAGRVEAKTAALQKNRDSYTCKAALRCLELISKTVPLELFGEEEHYGEANQRGEN